jgi:pimeloyl-ACP methyl ester carboxylesterase
MNFSDIGPVAESPDRNLRDLTALLNNAHIRMPIVLVGWSAGGMLARWYANLHPDAVAAIVTEDGSDFDFWDAPDESAWLPHALELLAKCKQLADSGVFATDEAAFTECSGYGNPLTLFPTLRRTLDANLHNPAHYSQWFNELEQEPKAADELRRSRRFYGAMPLRVIVAGDHFQPADASSLRPAAADIAFVQHAYQIAELSSESELIVAPHTSHAIHYDRPDFVLNVILSTVGRLCVIRPGVCDPHARP